MDTPGLVLWACYGGVFNILKGTVCIDYADTEADAKTECNTHWSTDKVRKVPCIGASSEAAASDCEDWDPVNAITTASSNHYEIDNTFVEYILEDTSRATNCDTAFIDYDDYEQIYFVSGAVTGTLLYQAGFRNGDVIEAVNSNSLVSLDDALVYFGDLYLNGETEYTFQVDRGGNEINIQIDIVSS